MPPECRRFSYGPDTMTGWLARLVIGVALATTAGLSMWLSPVSAATTQDAGRFVWRDLMTRDVGAAKRFYTELLGWRFEDTKRNGRGYALARLGSTPVAGIVDVSAIPTPVRSESVYVHRGRGQEGRARDGKRRSGAAGAAGRGHDRPRGGGGGSGRRAHRPGDASRGLDFYKQLAGYESSITDTRLGLEYHILKRDRSRAGLFQLPATAIDVLPNWLPYVLVADPGALAARVPGLGGRILVPASPERRNGSLAVVADPGGAPLALQKFPF